MIINCIIIDDEPLARKGMREYVEEIDFLRLAGEFDQALSATGVITSGEVELILLDIHLPRLSGLDFLRTLKNAPPVIFTSAYPQYALEGFELEALDYLVKPIPFERFLKAALRAKEYYEVRRKNEEERIAPASSDYFFVKADNRLVKISFAEILFIEALENYVVIHTTQKKYMSYLTFKSIEEYLPDARFIKTHKSYIVAADRVDSIEANDLRVGDHLVPMSRALKDEVVAKLIQGRFLKR